jgi:hypothetical protein
MSGERIDAYSTAVHEEITKHVIEQIKDKWLNNYINDYMGLSNGVREALNKKPLREWIEEGSKSEDYSFNPKELLTSHFHNPITNKGLTEHGVTIGESAYDRANNPNNPWSWQKARENLYKGLTSATKTEREKALAKSFEALGHLVHLIQDMAEPAHTRDDMHVPYVDGEPYEVRTNKKINELNYTTDPFLYWNVSISPSAPKQFWDLDTYLGSIPYSGGYIGLSEYTNANFFSKDTIFKSFPHPAKELTNYNDFSSLPIIVMTTPDNITHETFYITGYEKKHLAGLKYFAEELWNSPDLPLTKKYVLTPHLDNRCHDEYASQLIPRAVGYSAGLLEYFFRGQLDFEQTDTKPNGEIEIIIKNLSDDPLVEGIFELYYDDSEGMRKQIELSQFSVNDLRKDSSSPFKTTFVPPGEKENQYILVYDGKMGEEERAVIGKYKSLDCCNFKKKEPLTIGYTSLVMSLNESQTLTAEGGCKPYTWTLVAGGGTLTDNGDGTATYTAPSSNPNCVNNPTIGLMDCCGDETTLELAVTTGNWLAGKIFSWESAGTTPCNCIHYPGEYWGHWHTQHEYDVYSQDLYCDGTIGNLTYAYGWYLIDFDGSPPVPPISPSDTFCSEFFPGKETCIWCNAICSDYPHDHSFYPRAVRTPGGPNGCQYHGGFCPSPNYEELKSQGCCVINPLTGLPL